VRKPYNFVFSECWSDLASQITAWLRLSRADTDDVINLAAWLTTVTGRICLDMLRSRTARREEPLDVRLPDPVISYDGETDPEHEALTADAVGLALLVVLERLTPAERLAFVLHDLFGCRSAKSVRSWAGRQTRPRCWPAGPVAASGRDLLSPTPIRAASGRSSRHSWPPPGPGTSTRWSGCWIRTSFCGPTWAPRHRPNSPGRGGRRGRGRAHAAVLPARSVL
jgi:hypothetical protein